MSACGIIEANIAQVLGIDPKTLRKHFREELDNAAIKANAKVAATLFAAATSGRDLAATIFWMKVRLRWQEVSRQEISGPDGKPMEVNVSGLELLKARIDSLASRQRESGTPTRTD